MNLIDLIVSVLWMIGSVLWIVFLAFYFIVILITIGEVGAELFRRLKKKDSGDPVEEEFEDFS